MSDEKIIQYKFIKNLGKIITVQYWIFFSLQIISIFLTFIFTIINKNNWTSTIIWAIWIPFSIIHLILTIINQFGWERKKSLKIILFENDLEKAIKILKWNPLMMFLTRKKIIKIIENTEINYYDDFIYIKRAIINNYWFKPIIFKNEENVSEIKRWIDFSREYYELKTEIK
ncbi:hypothetical protein [Mesomycoplasma lagogenitalium]|uniref:DUF304 domain-containing protein n=1 Tax=Mesomycoplasma lagogenitalium TaxID=171286 RepID=A0ABY8LU41_9BACT|nr:hypothetical protein [Mesomycoplasma lagogenitalium]WGI36760.1 hypothetical protein QEG99_00520 [Mesomycoplasma lagogenitalium]